jgi:hypothetical protein
MLLHLFQLSDASRRLVRCGRGCNHLIYTLAPWEVRHLIQHYTLIGRDFEEVMRGRKHGAAAKPRYSKLSRC